jgi:ATP-dependent Clp protease ATP-binding subunit ClpC
MFERFSDQARRVLVLAQETARQFARAEIGDDLLLVGLAEQSGSTAGRALAEAGVHLDRLRERLPQPTHQEIKKHGSGGHIPFTRSAKDVMEGALREASRLNEREISTKHLLIALIKLDGAGVSMLRELEVDVSEVRDRVEQTGSVEENHETQATPWSTPKVDMSAQLAGIESTLQQILARLVAIESRLPQE